MWWLLLLPYLLVGLGFACLFSYLNGRHDVRCKSCDSHPIWEIAAAFSLVGWPLVIVLIVGGCAFFCVGYPFVWAAVTAIEYCDDLGRKNAEDHATE